MKSRDIKAKNSTGIIVKDTSNEGFVYVYNTDTWSPELSKYKDKTMKVIASFCTVGLIIFFLAFCFLMPFNALPVALCIPIALFAAILTIIVIFTIIVKTTDKTYGDCIGLFETLDWIKAMNVEPAWMNGEPKLVITSKSNNHYITSFDELRRKLRCTEEDFKVITNVKQNAIPFVIYLDVTNYPEVTITLKYQ